MRASRPIIIFFPPRDFTQVPKAAANLTTSIGVRASPGLPPIVPRMPEIDLIRVTNKNLGHKGNFLSRIYEVRNTIQYLADVFPRKDAKSQSSIKKHLSVSAPLREKK